jgi:hypothetical protein
MLVLLAINWTKWTAIGTLALAAGTVILAVVSWRAATAARAGLRVAQREIEAQIRPILVDAPVDYGATEQVSFFVVGRTETLPVYANGIAQTTTPEGLDQADIVSVAIRNAGQGAALIAGSPSIRQQLDRISGVATPTSLVVPAGEVRRLFFVIPAGTMQGWAGHFWVDVPYRDLAGGQFTRTRFFCRLDPNRNDWHVRGVALHEGHDETPFARTGEGWDGVPLPPAETTLASWHRRARARWRRAAMQARDRLARWIAPS